MRVFNEVVEGVEAVVARERCGIGVVEMSCVKRGLWDWENRRWTREIEAPLSACPSAMMRPARRAAAGVTRQLWLSARYRS